MSLIRQFDGSRKCEPLRIYDLIIPKSKLLVLTQNTLLKDYKIYLLPPGLVTVKQSDFGAKRQENPVNWDRCITHNAKP